VIEHQGFRIVLDLGYGTLPRLFALLGSSTGAGVDAVVVTHDHPDHTVDLHGFFRSRLFGAPTAPPVPLYATAGVLARVAGLEDTEADAEAVRRVFDWHPLPGAAYTVGPFCLESWALPHWVLNAGVRLSTEGLTIAYTGDTGPDPALVALGSGADLYIVEASDRRQQQPRADASGTRPRMHLTAREAGEVAAAAGADRLMLTHFWPGNDRERARSDASEAFPGEIFLADEGVEISLS
jgi:ribonuclease BN (tRNA processing enzyme)